MQTVGNTTQFVKTKDGISTVCYKQPIITAEGRLWVNYEGIFPLRIGGGADVTKKEYVEKLIKYSLPFEIVDYDGKDTVTVSVV